MLYCANIKTKYLRNTTFKIPPSEASAQWLEHIAFTCFWPLSVRICKLIGDISITMLRIPSRLHSVTWSIVHCFQNPSHRRNRFLASRYRRLHLLKLCRLAVFQKLAKFDQTNRTLCYCFFSINTTDVKLLACNVKIIEQTKPSSCHGSAADRTARLHQNNA